MESVLYERWGRHGLGKDHDRDSPQVGPVHLAAGYILSAMLGCRIEFTEDASPQVIPAQLERLHVSRVRRLPAQRSAVSRRWWNRSRPASATRRAM